VHKLAQSVLKYIRKHDLLRAGDRVGVAVSAGADSVALLRTLLELRPELGIVLFVVHFNHQLRGAESDADEKFVRELANAQGLDILCGSEDVKAHSARKKLSLETAARRLRYEFFAKVLRAGNVDKIATAHTVDDQAETVLLKLARGAGTRGLAGIYPGLRLEVPDGGSPHRTGGKANVIRPFLGIQRVSVEQFLKELKQEWREDSTNRDLKQRRNRVRHDILPRLEQLNPEVRETFADNAEIARVEEEFWSGQIETHLALVWKRIAGGGELDCNVMSYLELALQRRLVRAAGECLKVNLEFRQVEEVLALDREGARAMLHENLVARRHKGKICFESRSEPAQDYAYSLAVPGCVAASEAGIVIEAIVVTGPADGYNREQLLDSNRAQQGLVVRNWRAGDRFWPTHTSQPKKIKELLQDRRITGVEKKHWPVAVCGDEVVWVRGLGIGRDFQAEDWKGILIRERELQNPHSQATKKCVKG
jgi:tRNA(Ile)-lysidine synthase